MVNNTNETLDQLDYFNDEYIEKKFDEYSKNIGSFIIQFSRLEHSLNIAISELLFDDYHGIGYIMLEKLSFNNKISTFNNLARLNYNDDKIKMDLIKNITEKLEELNKYRNKVAHSNWSTLDKYDNVRTQICSDKNTGEIIFKKTKISNKSLEEKTKEINELINSIENDFNS